MKFPSLLTLCAYLLVAGCAEKPNAGDAELRALLPAWFDTLNLIKASPRAAIPPQVAQMQAMRRQAEAIQVSECMQKPKEIFVGYMQSKIDMITDVLKGEKEYLNGLNAPDDFDEYNAAAIKCRTK